MRNGCEELDTLVRLWPRTLREAADKYAAHLVRYHFARRFATGKNVCDAACGVGYGSSFLAETAELVVGMDISAEAIAWAMEHFSRDNISFLTADLGQEWPVRDKFDVVVSFETMEHLKCPERFLDIASKHLVPGGMLVLSVPNGPLDFERHSDNENHLQHFSDADLRGILAPLFQKVEYFSQVYTKDLRHHLVKLLKMRSVRLVGNYDFPSGLLPDVKTWLAVAQK
jgi:2-polyprenyl-3-methyl-5-hydroxy-6-metoxy-1,4-benzoquinol methylase